MLVLRRLAALLVVAVALQPSTLAHKGHHRNTKNPHELCALSGDHGKVQDHVKDGKQPTQPSSILESPPTPPSEPVAKSLMAAEDPSTPSPTATPAPAPTSASPAVTPSPTTAAPSPTTVSPAPTTKTTTAAAFTVNPLVAPLATVTYNGIGGTGVYGKVSSLTCPSSNTCSQNGFAVSGPLAPFDEDLTLALRGPMNIDDIAVFASSDVSMWSRVSSYSKQAGTSENMVFLNNKGDPAKSGVFDTCNGNSQSYATTDGKTAASLASQFSGVLADDVQVNIMSAKSCADSGTCGVSRGVAQEGWKGNNKIFMVKATMPTAPTGGKNVPAIWLLNGQVVRTAQYGCNCRGVGDSGKWKGGCGELDVAEVLPADTNALTSTIYSFKGSRGTSMYAQRPMTDAVVFVVILSQQTTTGSTNLGMAQVLMFKPEDVDMTTAPTNEQVQQWLLYRNGVQVNFDI